MIRTEVLEADQVVVIDDEQVVGVGTHKSLLAHCHTHAEFAYSPSVASGGTH